MRRYTTPKLTLNIVGVDLSEFKTFTTLAQSYVQLDFEDLPCTPTEDGCTLELELTQEQSAMFMSENTARIQVRFIDSEGQAGATDVKSINIANVLKQGVISYGE